MKIVVDTKEDSKEDIERAARFLLSLATGASAPASVPEVKEGAFGMFDEEPKPAKKPFNINQIIEY